MVFNNVLSHEKYPNAVPFQRYPFLDQIFKIRPLLVCNGFWILTVQATDFWFLPVHNMDGCEATNGDLVILKSLDVQSSEGIMGSLACRKTPILLLFSPREETAKTKQNYKTIGKKIDSIKSEL